VNARQTGWLWALLLGIPLWLLVWPAFDFFMLQVSRTFQYAGVMDFPIFLEHARNFIDTGVLYARDIQQYGPGAPIYKFPPLFGAMLVFCMEQGATDQALFSWALAAQEVCFFGSALLMVGMLYQYVRWPWAWLLPVVLIVALLFPPNIENVLRLQLDAYVLLLLTAALFFLLKEKNGLAGFCVGLAILLKVYPVVLLVYFLMRRQWAACVGVLVACLMVTTATLAMLGVAEHAYFLSSVLPVMLMESASASLENLSLAAYVIYFQGDGPHVGYMAKPVVAACVLVAGWGLFQSSRMPRDAASPIRTALDVALLITLVLIGLSNSWWNYQILLLIPTVVILVAAFAVRPVPWALVVFFAFTCAVLFVTSHAVVKEMIPQADFYKSVFYRGLTNYAFFIVLLVLQRRYCRPVSLSWGRPHE
jgi:hypothetical protein